MPRASVNKSMAANLYGKILNFFSTIGLIPKTKIQMKVVVFVMWLLFVSTLAVYFFFYSYVMTNVMTNGYLECITDLIFDVVGFLCPYLNYSLRTRFPDIFCKLNLKGKPIFYYIIL